MNFHGLQRGVQALSTLEHFWNRYMSDDPRIILIVCGSAASWMIKKSKGNRRISSVNGQMPAYCE